MVTRSRVVITESKAVINDNRNSWHLSGTHLRPGTELELKPASHLSDN